MKKILMIVGRMHYGGLENLIINLYRRFDRSKVMVDFMVNYDEPGVYDDEIRKLGGNIYVMPRLLPQNYFKYKNAVDKFFRQHKGEYDIVHGHLTSAGVIYLKIAKKYGIKTRIIHAHYTSTFANRFPLLERLMLLSLKEAADYYFACSDKAGEFCFGKKKLSASNYVKFKNGIDIDKFVFSSEKRASVRQELGIENRFVICHVGRFEKEKNHLFLLEAFREMYAKDQSATLLLVGSGSLEDQIKAKISELGLSKVVLMLGLRDDVEDILQGADVLMLPSLAEGLPVIGVEAQAAGLPAIFSDTITPELKICENVAFLPIDSAKDWAKKAQEFKGKKRQDTREELARAGYDIVRQAEWLQKFYLEH